MGERSLARYISERLRFSHFCVENYLDFVGEIVPVAPREVINLWRKLALFTTPFPNIIPHEFSSHHFSGVILVVVLGWCRYGVVGR